MLPVLDGQHLSSSSVQVFIILCEGEKGDWIVKGILRPSDGEVGIKGGVTY